jgi:integrase
MSKRAKSEGSVFRRADGRWVAKLSLGRDDRGKRLRKTVYGQTQSEALAKLDELRQQFKRGGKAIANKDSLAAFLKSWLESVKLHNQPKTHEEYEAATRLYIVPYIGSKKLVSLSGADLQQWQDRMARGKHSANTRLKAIRVLRVALNKAVKLLLIPSNPIAAIDKPAVRRREISPLEPEQCESLFAVCKEHRIGDLVILAALTGLRKGELFALEWQSVNLAEGVLVVRKSLEETGGRLRIKEPKTAAGRRMVALGQEAIEALRRRKEKAEAEGLDTEKGLVFCSQRGGYLYGSNFRQTVWLKLREAAGLPDTFRFHDLRHTQASLLLASGASMKLVQARLGHADFATTANVYSHLLEGAQAEAAEKLDEFLRKRVGTKSGYTAAREEA